VDGVGGKKKTAMEHVQIRRRQYTDSTDRKGEQTERKFRGKKVCTNRDRQNDGGKKQIKRKKRYNSGEVRPTISIQSGGTGSQDKTIDHRNSGQRYHEKKHATPDDRSNNKKLPSGTKRRTLTPLWTQNLTVTEGGYEGSKTGLKQNQKKSIPGSPKGGRFQPQPFETYKGGQRSLPGSIANPTLETSKKRV